MNDQWTAADSDPELETIGSSEPDPIYEKTESEEAEPEITYYSRWDSDETPSAEPYAEGYAYSEQRIKDLEARIEELEYMTDQADLGLSDDRFAPDQPSTSETVESEPEPELTMEDMGVGLNDQWEEPEEKSAAEPVSEPEPMLNEEEVPLRAPTADETEREIERPLAEAEQPSEPEPEFSENSYRRNNLVLLLDVSASMKKDDKMVKLKTTVNRLVSMLRDVDVLTIITYNTKSYNVLPAIPVKTTHRSSA